MEIQNDQLDNEQGSKVRPSYKHIFKQSIRDILEFGKENIRDGFRLQIIYLKIDIQNKAFHRESENYDRALQNLRLLYRKNLIIVLLVGGPLFLIPLPGTTEIGIYLYYKLIIKSLPENIQKRFRLEFQTREDLPSELVYAKIKGKIHRKFKKKPKIKE